MKHVMSSNVKLQALNHDREAVRRRAFSLVVKPDITHHPCRAWREQNSVSSGLLVHLDGTVEDIEGLLLSVFDIDAPASIFHAKYRPVTTTLVDMAMTQATI